MKTILITAYAVNPFNGSEDGTGWHISREIAKQNKVILITRKNNIPHLKKYIAQTNDPVLDQMSFYGFDLPGWAMRLKKKLGERGYVLYFYFWQLLVTLFIKRHQFKFDMAHSLNFHSDSHPHFLWLFGKPTFWGPIGHHPKVPKKYLLKVYGWRHYLKDRLYFTVKWMMRNLDPFFRLAVYKTDTIFAINSTIEGVLPGAKGKVVVLPAVATEVNISQSFHKQSDQFNVLSVGRFHYMKGFDITIRAFAHFFHQLEAAEKRQVKLVLVGKGNEKSRLVAIAEAAKVAHKIEWIDWVERSEMKGIYERSNVFLFPSHEGAGMVVPEAMSYGLSVLCFNNAGPGELLNHPHSTIDYNQYSASVIGFADKLMKIYKNPVLGKQLGTINHRRSQSVFNWQQKGEIIHSVYHRQSLETINHHPLISNL